MNWLPNTQEFRQKMVIVLCKFPSPKSRNTQPLFKNSEYCKSVYPKAAQVPFSEEVASKIRSEAQSPGKTVVVGKSHLVLVSPPTHAAADSGSSMW